MLPGLLQLLTSDATVNGIIHGHAYEDALPRGFSPPAIVVHRYNGLQDYDFNNPVGVEETFVQIDSYANSGAQRESLRAAIKAVLDDYSGTMPDGTVVQGCFLDRSLDPQYVTSANAINTGFRSLLGYRIVSVRA